MPDLQIFTAIIFGPVLLYIAAAALVGFAMLLIAAIIRSRLG